MFKCEQGHLDLKKVCTRELTKTNILASFKNTHLLTQERKAAKRINT